MNATILFGMFIFLFVVHSCGFRCKASEASKCVENKEYDKAIKLALHSIYNALLSAVVFLGASLVLIIEKLH
jgi:hypothetical protein